MLPRPLAYGFILLGVTLIGLSGLLSFARRDDPTLEWILYTSPRQTTAGRDLYAVLPDGRHQRQLMSVRSDSSMYTAWSQPGWFSVTNNRSSDPTFSLVHLNGQRQSLFDFQGSASVQLFYEEPQAYYFYVNEDLNGDGPRNIWRMDRQTGTLKKLDLPLPQLNLFYWREGGRDLICWSNHESEGDLYRLRMGDPLTVTRLTTRGDISPGRPSMWHDGSVYFYLNTDGTTDTLEVYRLSLDDLAEYHVADVLQPTDVPYFWAPNPQKIYFWTGTPSDPILTEANFDGNGARPVPKLPPDMQIRTWSPDFQWAYFTEARGDGIPTGNQLKRFNVVTGAVELVSDKIVMAWVMRWAPDGEWIYGLAPMEDNSAYYNLYRVRPTGTAETLVRANVRANIWVLEKANLLTFDTYDSQNGYGMYVLNLDTFALHRVLENQPVYRSREIVGSVPSPAYDWNHGEWLVIGGIVGVGIGSIGLIRRRI